MSNCLELCNMLDGVSDCKYRNSDEIYIICYFLFVQINVAYTNTYSYGQWTNKDNMHTT